MNKELLIKELESGFERHELDMLRHAIYFADEAHKGQYRKATVNGKRLEYIVHPLSVALILKKGGLSLEAIIAGILHDTVEDTSATIEDIEMHFGKRVRKLVAFNTENKDHTWHERKQHTIDTIALGEQEEKALVVADKLDNLSGIYHGYKTVGEEVWKSFKCERAEQHWYFGSIAKNMYLNLTEKEVPLFFKQYEQLVTDFFEGVA